MKWRIVLPTLVSLAGCIACGTGPDDGAPPAVEVTISGVDQAAGLVSSTVRNIGGQTLTFSGCMGELESGETGEWVTAPQEYACDMYGGFLQPGKSVDFEVALPTADVGCPFRVSAALGVDKVLDQTVTGHSAAFCPKAD
jgi:hypothetical protein